jgi:hypothetical protein
MNDEIPCCFYNVIARLPHLHSPAPNHDLLSKSGGVRAVQVSAGLRVRSNVPLSERRPLDMASPIKRRLLPASRNDLI